MICNPLRFSSLAIAVKFISCPTNICKTCADDRASAVCDNWATCSLRLTPCSPLVLEV
jgi:hypothetical protein